MGVTIGLQELLIGLGIIVISTITIASIFVLESEYHFIENGINSVILNYSDLIFESFLYSKKTKYKRKKAAPRIKMKSKKEAKQAAFLKGGKKEPIFHNGKHGPHFHPNNPKFKHWHFYYAILYWFILNEYDSEEDIDELYRFIYN